MKIDKEIIKRIKVNPAACVFYRGYDKRVMDLILENGGVLNPEQITKYNVKASDFFLPDSNARKAIVRYVKSINLSISEQEVMDIFAYLFSCNEDIMLTANLNLFKEEYFKLLKLYLYIIFY